MMSFAFLYPYETFILTLPEWVEKFIREANGLKYTAETGKDYCCVTRMYEGFMSESIRI